jgi:hypothetical protein
MDAAERRELSDLLEQPPVDQRHTDDVPVVSRQRLDWII